MKIFAKMLIKNILIHYIILKEWPGSDFRNLSSIFKI